MKLSHTKNNKSNKKIIIMIAAAVAVLAIGGSVSAYYILNQQNQADTTTSTDTIEEYNRNDVNLDTTTDEQQQAGSDIKKDAIDKDTVTQPPATSLSLSFTSINQNDPSLQIRTLIDSVTSSGICTLTLTKDGATVTKSSALQPLANSSTCQGFDVPLSELSKGTWTVKLTVTSGSASGEVSRTTEIK